MDDFRLRRQQLQQVTDRLIVEYAGALPPGQVMAVMVRAQRQLRSERSPWSADRSALCETIAREHLTRRLASPYATAG